MKFTAERDALVAAIGAIHVGKRNDNLPILGNVLIVAGNGQIMLTSHAMDFCASMPCPAEVDEPGQTTVPASELLGLLNSASAGSQVQCTLDRQRLSIRFGRSNYKLGTLPAEEFPAPLECEATDTLELTPEEAQRLFDEPEFAIDSATKADAYRQGIFLHNTSRKVVATAATCGVQLARVSVEGLAAINNPIIVTQQAAREIVKAAKAGPVKIEWSKDLLSIISGSWRFTTKLIDAQFPEYERLIADYSETPRLVFERKALLAACERLALVADRGTIEFSWDTEPSLIRANVGGDAGDESIECEGQGMAAGSFKLPPAQFVSLLKAVPGEHIELFFEVARPIQIRVPTRPNYVALQTQSA